MHLVAGQVNFCRAIRDNGLDIAFFESAATPPMISPDLFRDVELPALTSIMNQAAEVVGHPVPCIIGGNTEPIMPYLLQTGTGYVICPGASETDQASLMKQLRDRPDVRVRINCDPSIIARGPVESIRDELDRLLKLIDGHPNVCIGTGALPYETPPEHVLQAQEYVKDK